MKSKDAPSLKTEIVAGVTTFFTMAYIVVVNPAILATEGTGMEFSGVLTATVLVCFLMTLLMGVFAKLPFAVAPGMGINAFFAFSIILGQQVPWQTALGMVFWAGVIFILISITPLREMIAEAIPLNLRIAAASGIGLFLSFIGLKNAGWVVSDPVTFVKLGTLTHDTLLAFGGLAITVFFMNRKNPFAFLTGILAVTLGAVLLGRVTPPENLLSMPDFHSVFFKLNLWDALAPALLPTVIVIMFTDLFDSISTFVGVSQATGMVDRNGQPKNLRQGLLVDAFSTLGAGLFGSSSGTAYMESAAGIGVGGRTGRTAIVTALCFLPCLFVAPFAAMVPFYATAPILILVGALMFRTVTRLDLSKLEDMVPAFLTIILIPLTFSITQGILWGFITHVALYWMAGRRREVHPMMVALGVISVFLVYLENN